MKEFTRIAFDPIRCREGLADFRRLLDSKPELEHSEGGEVGSKRADPFNHTIRAIRRFRRAVYDRLISHPRKTPTANDRPTALMGFSTIACSSDRR